MSGPHFRVDLRSDTVTSPTPEMRAAMADADVGDDGYGEDPTVNRLESLAAALLGTEAAVFTPSGRMANQLALMALGIRGTEVLCGARSHVFRYEQASAAGNAGVQLHPLRDDDGLLGVGAIEAVLADQAHHVAPISVLMMENTHMPASGRPWPLDELDAVTAAARAGGLAVHIDGARIWNASVATGIAPSRLVRDCDTVMFCLSKGLGAPVGSLLCGPSAVIETARVDRGRLGGGMRQGGVVAAAGIVALETMAERLADDHVRAGRLAAMLAERFAGCVDPTTVETNIVCVPLDRLPDRIVERLADRGVHCGTIDARTVRFVTHKDVDDADLDRVRDALDEIAGEDTTERSARCES